MDSIMSSGKNETNGKNRGLGVQVMKETLPKEITELSVLYELLYAFQGVSGNTFEMKPKVGGNFCVSSKLLAFPSMYQHAAHLVELGMLHVQVQMMIDFIALDAPPCLAALGTSMRGYLNNFKCLVSELESQLRVKTLHAMHELKWLVIVVENCKGKRGGALLTILDELMNHGNPKVQEYLKPMFSAVAKVYYSMLGHWLKASEFSDPHSEFFISTNGVSQVTDYRMKDIYRLTVSTKSDVRPLFVSWSQACQALEVGQNISLLHKILGIKSKPSHMDFIDSAITTATFKVGHLAWRPNGVLQTLLDRLQHEASQLLVVAMQDQGRLMLHLKGLTGFLLLRQGRFARELMNRLGFLLDQRSSDIMEQSLQTAFDESVLASCSDSENICDLIKVKLLQTMEPDSLGWDVFTLQYCISHDDPIALIIPDEAVQKYVILFEELLRTKRIERMVCNILKTTKTHWRMFSKNKDLAEKTLRSMHLLASQMNQQMRQVVYYLQHESIEHHWQLLLSSIEKASSIPCLLHAHECFIDSIMQCIFFDQEYTEVKAHLSNFYTMVFQLEKLCNTLCPDSKNTTAYVPNNKTTVKDVENKLPLLKNEFDLWAVSFVSVLNNASQFLKSLIVHINFNDFYSYQE